MVTLLKSWKYFVLRDWEDLHYKVGTDVTILSYNTTIDWSADNVPDITESDPRRQITVDWDLSDKPVPYCTWVTITTEFVLPAWNAIEYEDVRFTYPDFFGIMSGKCRINR